MSHTVDSILEIHDIIERYSRMQVRLTDCSVSNVVSETLQGACPQDWTFDYVTSACVRIFQQPKTWSAARQDCERNGARLLEIKSTENQAWLESHKADIGGWSRLTYSNSVSSIA